MGENARPAVKVRFDRRVRLEFHGVTITSDPDTSGLTVRELDEALGLTEMATGHLLTRQKEWVLCPCTVSALAGGQGQRQMGNPG